MMSQGGMVGDVTRGMVMSQGGMVMSQGGMVMSQGGMVMSQRVW